MGAELSHADGQTDMTKLIVTFRNFANARRNFGWTDKLENILTVSEKGMQQRTVDRKLKVWVEEMDCWVEQVTDQGHSWSLFNFHSFVAED